jgi:hypothetical protein
MRWRFGLERLCPFEAAGFASNGNVSANVPFRPMMT